MSRADHIKTLRLQGQLPQAMKQASEALGQTPSDFELMGETIRVLILADQPETANNLYQVFASAPGGQALEPAAMIRLALQMDRQDLLEGMPPPENPAWLVDLLTGGTDPLGPFLPAEVQLTVANGPSVFHFSGPCPHCGHRLETQVQTSLLVFRQWLCPACFGQVKLDHHGALDCLAKSFPDLLQLDPNQSDAALIDYLRPRLMGALPAPDIVLALGQEYHFLINEIILNFFNRPQDQPGVES